VDVNINVRREMKLHFKEEPRSSGKVSLSIAVTGFHPLMQPFALKVTTKPKFKVILDTDIHLDHVLYAGNEVPSSLCIYTGLLEAEESKEVIVWAIDNLYGVLESNRWLRYLSEATIKTTKAATKKET
jgi:hypothetical protein